MIEPPRLDELKFPRELRRAYNKLRDYVVSLRIADGVGYRVNRLATGQELRFSIPRPEPSEGASVKLYQVTQLQNNYLTCREVDASQGGFAGTSTIIVLKPWALWPTSDAFAPSGTTAASLAAATGQTRTLTVERTIASVVREFDFPQTVSPLYVAGTSFGRTNGSWILAASGFGSFDASGGNTTNWIDLNIEARRWELDIAEALACVNNESKYILVQRSGVEEEP